MPLRRERPRASQPEGDQSPWRVEGGPPRDPAGEGVSQWSPPGGRRFWWILVALLALNFLASSLLGDQEERAAVPYTYFREQVAAGNVAEVTSKADAIQGEFRRPTDPPTDDRRVAFKRFQTVRPAFAQDDELLKLLIDKRVVVNARPLDEGRSLWEVLLVGFGPTLLLVGLVVFAMRRAAAMGGGLGGLGGLGRSQAKRYESSEQRTTFEDVAGIDEAEEELVEIVDFLRNPDRYRRLGAAIPRGVLLTGPPGTGKTLLARAVAGEADVPFFSLSASEFIEMVVGVGASRVRDLFNQAKEAAPAIVFVDELDAIGRSRGGGAVATGGHDEREQTLNQILTEMDGFDGTEGVVVLGATNRPEILDPALLRRVGSIGA